MPKLTITPTFPVPVAANEGGTISEVHRVGVPITASADWQIEIFEGLVADGNAVKGERMPDEEQQERGGGKKGKGKGKSDDKPADQPDADKSEGDKPEGEGGTDGGFPS